VIPLKKQTLVIRIISADGIMKVLPVVLRASPIPRHACKIGVNLFLELGHHRNELVVSILEFVTTSRPSKYDVFQGHFFNECVK
jgi:hypothetical protein